MTSTLIEGATIITLDDADNIRSPGHILIEENCIRQVGPGTLPDPRRSAVTRVIDASGKIAMPGLVNGHVHLFQSFVRGLSDDRPLLQWLEEVVWPVFAHMTPEDVQLAAAIGLIENVRGGATAVIDNHYVHTDPACDDAVCEAAANIGLRYQLARGWADKNYHPALMESPGRIFSEMARLTQTWHGKENGRISVAYGPLIPWGCSDESMQRMTVLARRNGQRVHMHIAETQAEVALSLEQQGQRHVEWLAGLDALGPHFCLVHGVWLDDGEIDMVAESGAAMVHCPVSNMFLASGVPPIARLRQRGVAVALATDGQACNNGQEMIDLLKWTANLAKVHELDATALDGNDVLRMACQGGAQAFGAAGQWGSLQPGLKADLILLNTDSPRLAPGPDVRSTVVDFATSRDIDTMLVDGQLIMEDGRLTRVDEEDVLSRAREARANLLKRAGVTMA